MIKNRNLDPDSRIRVTPGVQLDLSADEGVTKTPGVVIRSVNKIKIRKIIVVYSTATDANNDITALTVGIPGALTKYYNTAVNISKAQWTVELKEPASTDLVDAQKPILIGLAAGASTNGGVIDVYVEYEVIDRAVA